jgi:hypothetical protein
MAVSDISVEPLRSSDLKRLKPITWSKIDVTVRFNQVGAVTIDVPAADEVWDLITFDTDGSYLPNLFLIDWHGVYQVPVIAESWNPVKSIDDSGNVSYTITFAGADCLSLLANRLVYRIPTTSWAAQGAGTTTVTDKAESLIKGLVSDNVVTAGETARRVPHFRIATDLTRGGTASYQMVTKDAATTDTVSATTGQTLMDMVRAVAAQTPIGVRVDMGTGELVFDVYVPRDLSQKVVFSEQLGNLRSYSLSDATPTGNAILMQTGATSGAFVTANGAGATDPWRRVEVYSDQTSTTDATQIALAQTEALAQGAGAAKLGVTVADLPRVRFGADATGVQGYREGDIVAVDIRDGITYTDVVSAVQLTADASQQSYTETVTPTIGTSDTDTSTDQTATAKLAARVRQLEKQLLQVQKR